MSLITMHGFLGSGAPEIGREVADTLHIDYVDREIITELAQRLHLPEQRVIAKEILPNSLLGRISESLNSICDFDTFFAAAHLPTWQLLLDDTHYLKILEFTMRELARSRSILVHGRGSQFILKDYPGSLHLLIVAPLGLRVKRVMERLKTDQVTARQEVSRFDNSHREFTKRYFQSDIENPVYYNVVVNTENVSFEAAASIIIHSLSLRRM
jgi:cytidylate kinase